MAIASDVERQYQLYFGFSCGESGVPGENRGLVTSHRQTLAYKVLSSRGAYNIVAADA